MQIEQMIVYEAGNVQALRLKVNAINIHGSYDVILVWAG